MCLPRSLSFCCDSWFVPRLSYLYAHITCTSPLRCRAAAGATALLYGVSSSLGWRSRITCSSRFFHHFRALLRFAHELNISIDASSRARARRARTHLRLHRATYTSVAYGTWRRQRYTTSASRRTNRRRANFAASLISPCHVRGLVGGSCLCAFLPQKHHLAFCAHSLLPLPLPSRVFSQRAAGSSVALFPFKPQKHMGRTKEKEHNPYLLPFPTTNDK